MWLLLWHCIVTTNDRELAWTISRASCHLIITEMLFPLKNWLRKELLHLSHVHYQVQRIANNRYSVMFSELNYLKSLSFKTKAKSIKQVYCCEDSGFASWVYCGCYMHTLFEWCHEWAFGIKLSTLYCSQKSISSSQLQNC